MNTFIKNAWYMAAWSDEVTSELFARKLLGQSVLLIRGEDGEAVALRDQCPHRFAPLSMGFIDEGRIVCKYHGLAFDTQGTCVRNPYSDRIPESASLYRYSAIERFGMVWVWMGDQERADPDTIPDYSTTVPADPADRITGYTNLKANYEYGTDNLLDLSHIEFLHTGTFAGNGVIFAGNHSVKQDGNRIRSDWWMPGVRCPIGLDQMLRAETIDHWLDMRWDAPANLYLQIGGTLPGEPRETGATLEQAHLLTPADEGETHYFWSTTIPHSMPAEHAAAFKDVVADAFNVEDKPMIEASYANARGDFWGQKPVSIGVDAAGARARRIIESLKKAEAALAN